MDGLAVHPLLQKIVNSMTVSEGPSNRAIPTNSQEEANLSAPGVPLLTIIVPTYNRADCLALLLATLRSELAGLDSEVTVMVSDNASTDGTSEVTRAMQAEWPALVVRRQFANVGAEENFCSCVDLVTSRHFWIIGDDDLPKRGVIRQILALLREREPWLLYMQSEWLVPVTGPDQGERVGELRTRQLDATAFATQVHVWMTFVSGVIVNRAQLQRTLQGQPIRRFSGTSLVQLGWILPLLRADGLFSYVSDRCILATKDNSGGYQLLTVFGVNFARIVKESLGAHSPLARILIKGAMLRYLPGRVWSDRRSRDERFLIENPWPAMRHELSSFLLFWLIVWPIGRLPLSLAQPFYQSWRVFHRIDRDLERLRDLQKLPVSR